MFILQFLWVRNPDVAELGPQAWASNKAALSGWARNRVFWGRIRFQPHSTWLLEGISLPPLRPRQALGLRSAWFLCSLQALVPWHVGRETFQALYIKMDCPNCLYWS